MRRLLGAASAVALTVGVATVLGPSSAARADTEPTDRTVIQAPLLVSATAPLKPLSQTFALHSDPSAPVKLFLNFKGGKIVEDDPGVSGPASPMSAYDPAGNGASFTNDELAMIQDIWSRVASAYSPFQVDVTTAPATTAALTRTSTSDKNFGDEVFIGKPSFDTSGGETAGVNFGRLDQVGTATRPHRGVCYQSADQYAAVVADCVTHEFGHSFGLAHMGTASSAYDYGNELWGPIMGGYGWSGLVTWSNGKATGEKFQGTTSSSNKDPDEIAQIASIAPLKTDEAGSTIATAKALSSTKIAGGFTLNKAGYITSDADADVYQLPACPTGNWPRVSVTPAAVGPTLDTKLTLTNKAGTALATVAPTDSLVEADTPLPVPTMSGGFAMDIRVRGLDASTPTTLKGTGAAMYAKVEGVQGSHVNAHTGTNDIAPSYGSVGSYTLNYTCTTPIVPHQPLALSASPTAGGALAVQWTRPATDSGLGLSSYQYRVDNGAWETAPGGNGLTSYNVTTGRLRGGRHTVSVRGVDSVGAGPAVTKAIDLLPPLRISDLRLDRYTHLGQIDLDFTVPSGRGIPVTGSVFTIDGKRMTDGTAGSGVQVGAFSVNKWQVGTIGQGSYEADNTGCHVYGAALTNAFGTAPAATLAVSVSPTTGNATVVAACPKPGKPRKLKAKPGKPGGKATLKLSWKPGKGVAPLGYDLRITPRGKHSRTTIKHVPARRHHLTLKLKKHKRYRITVAGAGLQGDGPAARFGKKLQGR